MKRMIALCCIFLFVFACEETKPADPAAPPTVKEQPQAAPTPADEPAEEVKADEKAPAATAEAKADDRKHGAACTCKAGKDGGTVWCQGCGVGYIKGEKSTDKAAVSAALSTAKPTE
jgi:hypothetical protein